MCSVTRAVSVTWLPSAAVRPYSTRELDGSSVSHVTVAWPSASAVALTLGDLRRGRVVGVGGHVVAGRRP